MLEKKGKNCCKHFSNPNGTRKMSEKREREKEEREKITKQDPFSFG